MQTLNRSSRTLLLLGFVIGLLQVTYIGMVLFKIAPIGLAVVLKVTMFGCIGWFALTAVRRVHGAGK